MTEDKTDAGGEIDTRQQAASLMQWLSFYAAQPQEHCITTVHGLLQTAFPNVIIASKKTEDDWGDVVATLESFYEASLAIDTVRLSTVVDASDKALRVVLELVLGAVVQCETKAIFVRDILTMDDSVQADLMTIIEKVMAREVLILRGGDVQQENATVENKRGKFCSDEKKTDLTKRSSTNSSLYFSRNAALERAKRENDILKDENVHLGRELELIGKKLCDAEMEKRMLLETIQQLKEQLDVDVLRKERSLRALYDEQIQTLQCELDAAKVELRDKTVLASEVPALQDEVDLLRPLAKKMAKVNLTVAKYKAKIDELSGAKDSLRRVENTNSELVEKNLALETELIKAASWQRKLKQAKEANTVVEFRVSELETLLARERQKLSLAHTDLEMAHNSLKETSALNVQLQGAVEQQLSGTETGSNSYSAPTMAGGISEFNPEFMQKITRLEYENAQLKEQVDGETSARIDTLLDEIEDLTRLKRSFETKYFGTEQVLQSTQMELQYTKQQLESTATEFKVEIRLQTERQSCLEEDIASYVLGRHIFGGERTRLQTELCERKSQGEFLARALDTRDLELVKLREANEGLATRKEQLIDQLEYLSMEKEELKLDLQEVKQDCASRIAQQLEHTAMQMEDANAERLRFKAKKTRELYDICQQYEENAADTISQMTLLIEAKSCKIEQLAAIIRDDKLLYDEKRHKLEAANQAATKELEKYQEIHSVSNADRELKEEKLGKRIEELENISSRCKQQELTLKATIKSQLESNKRLVGANQALKSTVAQKGSKIEKLENTMAVLESKILLLEKERTHVSTQEKRKRGVKDETSRFSSQLNTQVSLMITELEKVLKENKELHQKLVKCHCIRGSPSRTGVLDSGQKAKKYYLNQIQQLEHEKKLVEHKRREILLVNAKLIQEQKQLQVKNVGLINEVAQLKESVNRWLLRDERRKKQERLSRSSPRENGVMAPNPSAGQSHETYDTSLLAIHEKTAPHSSETTPASIPSRKRKHEDYLTPEASKQTSAGTKVVAPTPTPTNEFTDAKDFFSRSPQPGPSAASSARHPKRRLTRFITRNLAAERTQQETEKPSECHQQ